jgi:hypothetical protein
MTRVVSCHDSLSHLSSGMRRRTTRQSVVLQQIVDSILVLSVQGEKIVISYLNEEPKLTYIEEPNA